MKSIGTVPLSKRVKYKISARPHAGLFFCLASAEGAGLLFLPCCNTAPYKRLQHVLFRPCNYAAHAAKRLTGLYRGFSCDLSHSTATNTRPTQAAIIPPAPRWSAHTHRDAPHRYQIPPPRRTLYSSAQPPIIIRYIRVRRCAPVMDSCQTVQYITDHASPAGSRCFSRPAAGGLAPGQWSRLYRLAPGRAVILAPSTRRAVQRRAARNHWRLSPQLFSGFRPITNRGQQ